MGKCYSGARTCAAFPLEPWPALVFGLLFTILSIVYIWFVFAHHRSRYWFLVLAALMSAGGYLAKFMASSRDSAWDYDKDERFSAFNFLLFLAIFPLNAFLYSLARDLYRTYIPAQLKIARHKAYLWCSLACEIPVIILQIIALVIIRVDGYETQPPIQSGASALLFASFLIHLLLYLLFLYQLINFRSQYKKHRKAGTLLLHATPEEAQISSGLLSFSFRNSHGPRLKLLFIAVLLLIIRVMYYMINAGTSVDAFDADYGIDIHSDVYSDRYWSTGTSTYDNYRQDRDSRAGGKWVFKWYEPGQIGADAVMVFLACLALVFFRPRRNQNAQPEEGMMADERAREEDETLELEMRNVAPASHEETPVLPLETEERTPRS